MTTYIPLSKCTNMFFHMGQILRYPVAAFYLSSFAS